VLIGIHGPQGRTDVSIQVPDKVLGLLARVADETFAVFDFLGLSREAEEQGRQREV
jgi:hypothetical protein